MLRITHIDMYTDAHGFVVTESSTRPLRVLFNNASRDIEDLELMTDEEAGIDTPIEHRIW